ncbi:MAG: response regulator [Pseudomonadota bacterium]
MRNRLLLIDGDARSLRVLDVSLRGEGFDVDTASNGTEGWTILETTAPDLIIADTELAGIDGFEFCARLRRHPVAAAIPLILLAPDKGVDQKIRSLEVGADDYLVKPAYVNEVVARVRALLQRRDRDRWAGGQASGQASGQGRSDRPGGDVAPPPPDALIAGARGSGAAAADERQSQGSPDRFVGDLAEITAVDLIQLVEANGRSGIAHLRGPTGAPASIYFRRGQVIDAEVGRLSGAAALGRVFTWRSGGFEIEWKNIRRRDAIERSPAELVIDGMRGLDEWNQVVGQLADPRAVFEVDYRVLAERLAEIPDEVNGILRLCDGVRTVRQVVEDSAMPDVDALTAMIRLRDEGIVFDRSNGLNARPTSGAPDPRAGWLGEGSSPFSEGAAAAGGIGSGPVEQSFADRLEVEARAVASGAREGVADRAEETGARRRRTAPGLGQSSPEGAVTPQTRQHSEAGVDAASEGGGGHADAIPEARVEQRNDIRFQAVAAARVPADSGRADAVPVVRASLTETHRGFGALPAAADVRGETSQPVDSSPGHGDAEAPYSGRVVESHRGGDPVPEEGPLEAGVVQSRASRPVSGGPRSASAPAHSPAPAPDQTVRVSFADDNISRHDALDELGLPSRWRGAKFLSAALVLGAGAAIAVHHFKRGATSEADTAVVAETDPPPARLAPPAGEMADKARAAAPPATAEPERGEIHAAAGGGPSGGGAAPPAAAAEPAATEAPPPAVALPRADVPAADSPNAAAHAPRAPLPPAAPRASQPHPAPAAPSVPAPPPPARSHAAVSEKVEGAPAAPASSHPAPAVSGAAAPPPAPSSGFARLFDACRTAFARNRMRDAATACAASVDANPESAEALTLLAHTELNRGHMSRAGALATRAAKIDPNMADAYVIIGGVRQDSGQNREAKEAYRRYLQLAPRGRYADDLRSIVNGL